MADKWPIGEPLPLVMNDADLMRVLGMRRSLFMKLRKLGTFDGLMTKPQLTKRRQYSGERVARWTSGTGEWATRKAS